MYKRILLLVALQQMNATKGDLASLFANGAHKTYQSTTAAVLGSGDTPAPRAAINTTPVDFESIGPRSNNEINTNAQTTNSTQPGQVSELRSDNGMIENTSSKNPPQPGQTESSAINVEPVKLSSVESLPVKQSMFSMVQAHGAKLAATSTVKIAAAAGFGVLVAGGIAAGAAAAVGAFSSGDTIVTHSDLCIVQSDTYAVCYAYASSAMGQICNVNELSLILSQTLGYCNAGLLGTVLCLQSNQQCYHVNTAKLTIGNADDTTHTFQYTNTDNKVVSLDRLSGNVFTGPVDFSKISSNLIKICRHIDTGTATVYECSDGSGMLPSAVNVNNELSEATHLGCDTFCGNGQDFCILTNRKTACLSFMPDAAQVATNTTNGDVVLCAPDTTGNNAIFVTLTSTSADKTAICDSSVDTTVAPTDASTTVPATSVPNTDAPTTAPTSVPAPQSQSLWSKIFLWRKS